MKEPSTAQIESDANITATYFLALIKKGVKPQEAASMSAMYLAQYKATDTFPGEEWKQ